MTKPKVLADQLEKLVNKAVKEIPVELEELNILKKQLNRHEDWLCRYEACIETPSESDMMIDST